MAAVHGRGHVRRRQDLQRRVPRDRPQGQRVRGQDRHVQGPRRSTTRPRRRPTAADGGQQGPARLLHRLRHAHADGDRRRDGLRRRRRSSTASTAARGRLHRSGRVQRGRQLHVDYRATDKVNNTSDGQDGSRSASSRARAARRPARTSSTARRWARSGSVTPATAARRASAHHVRRRPAAHPDGRLRARRANSATTARRPGELHRPGSAPRSARTGPSRPSSRSSTPAAGRTPA